MATVTGPPHGVIRDLPIMPRLRDILSKAADKAGVDHVRISSGGQVSKAAGGINGVNRTGSPRHDNGGAADLELLKGGHVLNFENPAERPIVAAFVTEASRLGATGIGASDDYMGPTKLHVGFGTKATWGGPDARSKDAPAWLRAAVAAASGKAPPASPRVLKLGDRGDDVKALQTKLGVIADGVFGSQTEEAVEQAQRAHGLTADGIVGPRTRAALGL